MGILNVAKDVAVFGLKAVGTVGLGVLDLVSRASETESVTKVLDDTIHNMWSEDKRKITFDSAQFADEMREKFQVCAARQGEMAKLCLQNGDADGYDYYMEQVSKMNCKLSEYDMRQAAKQCRENDDDEGYDYYMEQANRISNGG